jgi:PII-like signaling protein
VTGERKKMLLIFIQDSDIWEGQPLYEAIVRLLQSKGLAGATVWNGQMGYGTNREIHRSGLFGITDEKPVILAAIESEDKIRAVLPELQAMVREGLVALHDVEVFPPPSQAAP